MLELAPPNTWVLYDAGRAEAGDEAPGELMAVERDSSYREHAPADTIELVDQLRESGVEVKEPVWTVGRLDEREKQGGNGNGSHQVTPAPDLPADD